MTLSLQPPPCPDSPLRRLDPRWRLAALVLAAVGTSLLRTLPPATAALLAALVLAAIARLPPVWALGRVGVALLLVVFLAGPLPFLVGGDGWQFGPIHVSADGLTSAALVLAKAVALVLIALVLIASAPPEETLRAAHALRVPGLLVQLTALSYRYTHLLIEEVERLRIALRVRGFRSRVDRVTYRTIGQVVGTLLVRGDERAERVGQAMRCRGFDGRFHTLTTYRTKARDLLAFGLTVGLVAGLLAWDLW